MTRQSIDWIAVLFIERGAIRYGAERVSQLEHAVQCAALAECDGARDELVAASLLHDIGHLLMTDGGDAAGHSIDDQHEVRALPRLRRHFGDAVLAPIRLHVAAKRYLCAARPGYWDALSPASKASLQRQGGSYSQAEAARFMSLPYAAHALQLRVWDDRAKEPGAQVPGLAHYMEILSRCAYGRRNLQSQA